MPAVSSMSQAGSAGSLSQRSAESVSYNSSGFITTDSSPAESRVIPSSSAWPTIGWPPFSHQLVSHAPSACLTDSRHILAHSGTRCFLAILTDLALTAPFPPCLGANAQAGNRTPAGGVNERALSIGCLGPPAQLTARSRLRRAVRRLSQADTAVSPICPRTSRCNRAYSSPAVPSPVASRGSRDVP